MFCMFYVAEAMEQDFVRDDLVCALHAMDEGARMELIDYLERNIKQNYIIDSYCVIKAEKRCPYIHRGAGETQGEKQ